MVLQETKGYHKDDSIVTGKVGETHIKQRLCISGAQWREGHKNSRVKGTVEVGGRDMRREG